MLKVVEVRAGDLITGTYGTAVFEDTIAWSRLSRVEGLIEPGMLIAEDMIDAEEQA